MNATTATRHEFQAEVKQLLDLMIHSLYSNKEVFLRELISNASDALDRRRFEGITNESLRSSEEPHIRLESDRANHTLTIHDNGVGMSTEEVVNNLGTIARSGTKEFVSHLKEQKQQDGGTLAPDLIGQFGVGFYSSFMVAEEVTVVSRKAGENTATEWRSTADGSYELAETTRAEAGTSITLKLKPASSDESLDDFCDEYVLKRIIKKYSDFVSYPIRMEVTHTTPAEKEGDAPIIETKDEQLNTMTAIWTRPKDEVTKEEHEQFYRHIAHDWSPPLSHVHLRIDGTFEASGLLYIPSQAPFDLYHPEMKRGIQLYVRRVFIMDECKELAPTWLRFVKGVIDAQDLDLNVSREMLQQSRQIKAIHRQIIKKVLDELIRIQNEQPEDYAKLWTQFGPVLKEGLIQGDEKDKERLLDLLMSPSTKETSTSLQSYVSRMKEGQNDIYYLVSHSLDAARRSPHLEAFERRGYEVLFFSDNIDELWLERTGEFDGKKLVSIGHGLVDLEATDSEDEKKKKEEERESRTKELSDLLSRLRAHLQEDVKEVRLSARLTSSAVCLVGEEGDMSPQLEKLMSQLGKEVPKVKRILELNPEHAVVTKLKSLHEADPKDPKLKDYAELLYGQALLAEGNQIPDPARFSQLIAGLMA
ncbi:MAG: molecular chaperone HtpG [Myxococcales bacterium]|nr:molecular chaperone HtpG [Myxococcales bacterium]